MTPESVALFAKAVQASPIAGWQSQKLLSFGKSAAVFRAMNVETGAVGALKVFFPELVSKQGQDAQLIRIEREQALRQLQHDHLAKVLAGGICQSTGYSYVVMELVGGQRLSELIGEVDSDLIGPIIEQLARAAKFLEDSGIIHRDIKPDNIHLEFLSDGRPKITLLDFGVIKPVGDDAATNLGIGPKFIGTHQYCPPEMIHNKVAPTVDGWRAVTFYQIGAVVYDLVQGERIFRDFQDVIANLVDAVNSVRPRIVNHLVDASLISLADACLLKNPEDRLRLVNWSSFMFSDAAGPPTLEARKAALARRLGRAQRPTGGFAQAEAARAQQARTSVAIQSLRSIFDDVLVEFSDLLPPKTLSQADALYPLPAVTCVFGVRALAVTQKDMAFQIALQPSGTGEVWELFARASSGGASAGTGWTSLGSCLATFGNAPELLRDWVMRTLEETN